MLYFTAFILGFFGGTATVLCIRAKNSYRRRQYGLPQGEEQISMRPVASDDASKYSDIASSVDGSKAVKEFNQ